MAPEKLSRETVVEQAIKLADAEGLEAVTIRRLAQVLGVTPMALYWHFKNKDQLLEGMADHLLREVTPEFEPDSPWNVRLRAMVEALTGVIRRHPALIGLLPSLKNEGVESFTTATNTALDLLAQGGFALDEGFLISSLLMHGVIALVDGEPGCPSTFTTEEAIEWRRQKRLHLESLPADRFPRVVEFAKTFATEPDVERYYAFGIDLLMAGVEAQAARPRPCAGWGRPAQ
ncbi:TetR/AcrR family transcriptional regulator [Acrocarpospora macrocephala]|uniref:TetR/AcrR family transcriptional regulator n=1 Tax=Acrocarpospora macrocephala TaxID=150177 RepID=UPI0012D30A6C|nr:TetR family transcriptional regulator [Acrocarpospora macrocephala]